MEYIRGILNNFWRLTEASHSVVAMVAIVLVVGHGPPSLPLSLSLEREKTLCPERRTKRKVRAKGERERERGERMHPSCASRFLPVTSSCLAFYLGQTGIRLNALIKLLTWFGRPGGHRVSADELDLFCLCLPPPRSSEGGIDQGCATTRDRSGAPRLLVPLSHAPSPTPSAPDRDSNPYFTFDDVSDDERLSHRRFGLFAADLTTSRADRTSSHILPFFLRGKKTGHAAGWCEDVTGYKL